MRNPSWCPCIPALELLVSCFSCSLSWSLPTLSGLCLIYLRPVLWVWFSADYASVGRCMAALLTKFLPEASLTAVPETLPPMGVANGQCFLPERAVISSRVTGRAEWGCGELALPAGRLQRGVRPGPREDNPSPCHPLLAPRCCWLHTGLPRFSGCHLPSLPGFSW